MELTDYRTLGHSGLRVSPVTLGAMTFGNDWGWGASPEESKAVLAAYLQKGGNIIDTANVYTKGHSEKIIGDYIKETGIRRDRLVHIHNKLIEKARELLSNTTLTTAEVAYALGFEHPQSFNKLFKQKTTLSPMEFRETFN